MDSYWLTKTSAWCMCVVQVLKISYRTFNERLTGTEFVASGRGMDL